MSKCFCQRWALAEYIMPLLNVLIMLLQYVHVQSYPQMFVLSRIYCMHSLHLTCMPLELTKDNAHLNDFWMALKGIDVLYLLFVI